MGKVFVLAPRENWVCDRFVSEWYQNMSDISTRNLLEADTVWLLAGWCWNQIPQNILASKKVILTIHHIVPEKFNDQKLNEFNFRDKFVDIYHVPCARTREQIKNLTSKPICVIPFWVNEEIWKNKRHQKNLLREKFNIPLDAFLIGSFQRDTEGSDLVSPKLEKGPDLFCQAVLNYSQLKNNVHVLLAGWRRQYVMRELKKIKIPYYYFELPKIETVNDLYNCLDLYIVSSRHEGGPQSIVECATNSTPIISTDVGFSAHFLSKSSIFKPGESVSATPDQKHALESVRDYFISNGGLDKFKSMVQTLSRQTAQGKV